MFSVIKRLEKHGENLSWLSFNKQQFSKSGPENSKSCSMITASSSKISNKLKRLLLLREVAYRQFLHVQAILMSRTNVNILEFITLLATI